MNVESRSKRDVIYPNQRDQSAPPELYYIHTFQYSGTVKYSGLNVLVCVYLRGKQNGSDTSNLRVRQPTRYLETRQWHEIKGTTGSFAHGAFLFPRSIDDTAASVKFMTS